jgi:hypothetical protein
MSITKNLAKNEREWRALLKSKDPNVVRTRREWQRLIASKENPLAGVEKRLVEAFTKGLKFRNGDMVHADFSMIVDVVPYSRFRRIWEHFGMDITLLDDHEGYWCSSNHNCKKLADNICMTGC